ncbi:MAG TPA: 4Fe-4S dicluster domain-containing protein [Actinomycetospora sp.]|nr:4Fe-4S dicluster domain-containing protein [Actinomycetospora sp.]
MAEQIAPGGGDAGQQQPRWAKVIDQTRCIGCHACTTACKSENEVPVGVTRTYVKHVDVGTFPQARRAHQVTRCNQCAHAPCVAACPTTAMFKRADGIVDFDKSVCIGCKACMAACPYDAIFINPEDHSAEKCNFCAHRLDVGLEPACVVVCPVEAILVGDLDDPGSGISRLVTSTPTQVRSPEQNTGPNVFYLGAERAVLDPLAAPADSGYLYSRPDSHRAEVARDLASDPITKARTTLDTAHPRPWGWRVTTYLWAKGVGGGAVLLAALALLTGVDLGVLTTLVAPALGVVGTAATGVLLVWDLKRPERFWFILAKSNPRSWLVLGSYALGAFAIVSGGWLLYGIAVEAGMLAASPVVWTVVAVLGIPTGLMVAGYTAFLFGQAEGRDLWQSPLLFWHLIVQALMVGAGALAITALLAGTPPSGAALIVRTLVIATLVHVAMLVVEYSGRHATRAAATAAHLVTHGRYARLFWTVGVGLALLAALVAAPAWDGGLLALAALGGLAVQVALLAYESVFVRAGQDLPLS